MTSRKAATGPRNRFVVRRWIFRPLDFGTGGRVWTFAVSGFLRDTPHNPFGKVLLRATLPVLNVPIGRGLTVGGSTLRDDGWRGVFATNTSAASMATTESERLFNFLVVHGYLLPVAATAGWRKAAEKIVLPLIVLGLVVSRRELGVT